MNYLNEVLANIEGLTSQSQMDAIYAKLKDKTNRLNRSAAGRFRLNQEIEFVSGERYTGKVESIGRTGRVKITLTGHWKYSHFTMGANALVEAVAKAAA